MSMLLQFLKKSPLLLCVGTMLVFVSCNDDELVNESEYDFPSNPTMINSNENEDAEKSDVGTIEVEKDVSQNADTKESNTEVKLNPAHGEPGHSCEIPVGQPLPSSNSPANSNIGGASTNSNNTARINPPHGEPGHSCEIPVGQPLD